MCVSDPNSSTIPKRVLPPCNMTRQTAAGWIAQRRQDLLHRVSAQGAILLRGFGIDNAQHNQLILQALSNDIVSYKGGGSADKILVSQNISTVSPAPHYVQIPAHNELSYTENYPRYMAFFCQKSAAWGGQTILADGHAIYNEIDPYIRRKLQKQGVCCKRFMYNRSPKLSIGVRKSWHETFHCDDKNAVQQQLEKAGMEYQWTSSGLSVRQHRPAFINHPVTQKPVWFNQISNFSLFNPAARVVSKAIFGFRDTGVEFGDGTPVTAAMRKHIFGVISHHLIYPSWMDNDILLLDNIAYLHGRAQYFGCRVITVGMFN